MGIGNVVNITMKGNRYCFVIEFTAWTVIVKGGCVTFVKHLQSFWSL